MHFFLDGLLQVQRQYFQLNRVAIVHSSIKILLFHKEHEKFAKESNFIICGWKFQKTLIGWSYVYFFMDVYNEGREEPSILNENEQYIF